MKKAPLLFLFFTIFLSRLIAQTDSVAAWTFSGYAEPYYGYDFGKPADGNRPGFIYSHNRHNEFNLNIGFLKAAYSGKNARANLALMAGTYANANLAAEPGTLQNVFEANAGVKISKKHEIWLDGGIFGSHIGFESAIGKDCWALTRSLAAENSPYYEAGVKLSYAPANQKWLVSLLALNGWQIIRRPDATLNLASGWQIQYKPSDRALFNSSSFFGEIGADTSKLLRVFHNFYGIFQFSDRFGLTLGFDTGWQENSRDGESLNFWYSPVAIARYSFSKRLAVAARAEFYSDEDGVIVATGTPNGFQTLGLSANLGISLGENTLWCFEGKLFNSKDAIFLKNNDLSKNNAVFTSALAVWF